MSEVKGNNIIHVPLTSAETDVANWLQEAKAMVLVTTHPGQYVLNAYIHHSSHSASDCLEGDKGERQPAPT